MSLDIHRTKNELLAIFPQHSEETITRIYRNAVNDLGDDSHVHILPVCIEQLLELPSSSDERNEIGANPFLNAAFTPPIHGHSASLLPIGRDKNEIAHEQSQLKKIKNIPGLHDSDSSNDDYNTSSSDDEHPKEHENYRNKPRPAYREKYNQSPKSDSIGYLSDKDDLVFKDLDEEISELERSGFVKVPITGDNQHVITIKDSPLSQSRKRKLVNSSTEYRNHSPLVDLTVPNGEGISNNHNGIKKVILNNDASNNSISVPVPEPEPDITSFIQSGMEGYLEIAKEKIKAIIDDVDDIFLENLIKAQVETPIPQVVQQIVEHLLDNKNYPKIEKTIPLQPKTTFKSTSTITSSMDTFKYNQQAIILLQNSFPKVSTKVIRKVFSTSGNNYTKTFRAIETALETIISGEKKVEETIFVSFLKGCRNKIKINDLSSVLTDEIQAMQKKEKEDMEKGDLATAVALNTKQYDDEGQTIECGCCYNEVAFEDMVQCLDGHLFCSTCLQSYSKEAIYGSGKAQLFCMTDECDSTFPMSQMKKALTGELLDKFMERVQDEDIKLANLDNLVHCPSCDFAAEMDDGDKVFRCQNLSCQKETCRYCKEEWKDHFGVPCKELEKKEVTNLRTTYEEKMTQAKVRKCWQCSTIFLKSDGCNKMTCRCGAKMCYICRLPKIDYNHFCQHPRNPGEGCTLCKKCNLWSDPSEDDDRAVAEIKKQAEEEREKLGGEETSKISIGPAITIQPSTTRIMNPRLPLLQRFPVYQVPNFVHPNNQPPAINQFNQYNQQLNQQIRVLNQNINRWRN